MNTKNNPIIVILSYISFGIALLGFCGAIISAARVFPIIASVGTGLLTIFYFFLED